MPRISRLVLLLGVPFVLSACGLHGKPTLVRGTSTSAPGRARTPLPEGLDAPARVVAPGVVEARGGEIALSAHEAGWIAEIVVKEGQHVAAGQVLAVLDDAVQRETLELAKAELAEAETTLAKTLRGATEEERRQARAEAEASGAKAALARRDAERADQLGSDHAIAPAEVERANAEARAQAALARAGDARVAGLDRGARREDRAAVRERVAAGRARVQLAETKLAHRQVVAPIASTVLLSRFHVGEFYSPGSSPLFLLGDTSGLQVRFEVDEIDAFRVKEGAACAIYVNDNVPIVDGTVFRLAPKMGRRGLAIESPTARADVRVREVFVELPSTDQLVPGQRVWGHVLPYEPLGQGAVMRRSTQVD